MSQCLILNANAQPVSFLPLSVVSWQEAIQYMVAGKADVLEWHEDFVVRSAKWSTAVPAVMILRDFKKITRHVPFSKRNVFIRDNWTCQYCGTRVTESTATLDHVVPASKGGKTTYENSATACFDCNSRKGNDHTIVPKKKPHRPSYWELAAKKQKHQRTVHSSWVPYLMQR